MEDNEPTQIDPQLSQVEGQKSAGDLNDMKASSAIGIRMWLCSYILGRLVMVLSMTIVNNSTGDNGVFSYDKVMTELEKVWTYCKDPKRRQNAKGPPRDKFNTVESLARQILEKLALLETKTIKKSLDEIADLAERILCKQSGLERDRTSEQNELLESKLKTEAIDKTWRIRKSFWFKSTLESFQKELCILEQQSIGDNHLDDFCQKLRIAAVHEICTSFDIGWVLFENVEACGFMFCDILEEGKSYRIRTSPGKQKPFDIIDCLSNSRHYHAHNIDLRGDDALYDPEEPCGIKKFLDQFDAIIELMERERDFQKVPPDMDLQQKRRYLRYSFPDLHGSVADELGSRLRRIYPNVEDVLDEYPQLVKKNKQLVNDNMERDKKLWTAIESYKTKHNPSSYNADECYQQLLELVREPFELSKIVPKKSPALADLRALIGPPKTAPQPAGSVATQPPDEERLQVPSSEDDKRKDDEEDEVVG